MRRRIRALTICLCCASCSRADHATPGSDTPRTANRVVPVPVAAEPVDTAESGALAAGPSYEAELRASLLDGSARTALVTLAPGDTVDISNYQAAAWWLGRDDGSSRQRWRFSAEFARYASGVLVLKLDTLLARDQQQPPFHTALADSIAVRGLGVPERLSTYCRLTGYRPDDRMIGVMRDSTSGRWKRPRLAWFVDTAASRFRGIKPDRLACRLDEEPD